MDFFSKPVGVLKPEDLEALARSGIDENQTLEFKSALPNHELNNDPWVKDRKINDAAKFEVLKRLVAFANADGGWFIIGLAEPSDGGTYADRLHPLPEPGDLANRLQQLASERIDPPLSVLSIEPVLTDEGADEGVVVMRSPRSRRAPHAVKGGTEDELLPAVARA